LSGASGRVTEIHGIVEVRQELLAPFWCAGADGSAEVACAWITAQVRFWEENDVDTLCCGALSSGFERVESLLGRLESACLR
jgi:hypothetical protein